MQPYGSSDAVDQLGLGHGLWDDMAEVELDEVDGAGDLSVVSGDIAGLNKDGEDEGDEEERGGEEGKE